ncbi:MAG: ATP-binding cassette domain-containing protein [Bacteroidales bacterium]
MQYDKRTALSNVSLTINSNEFIAITGANGGGKSTLLKLILGLIKPTSGEIKYYDNGAETSKLNVGYLAQKSSIDNNFPITVSELIESGIIGNSIFSKRVKNKQQRIDETIALMKLEDYRNAPIGTLSGGVLQRTLLGRALISKPDIIILDEPLSYLDKGFEQELYNILNELYQRATILVVSHDVSIISKIANRHLIVNGGVIDCDAIHHNIRYNCE